jgi:hypothetical protein
MFLLTMGTIIITLLWSVQLIAPMHSQAIYIWLNLSMPASWITLCTVFVHKHRCPKKKYTFSWPIKKRLSMPLLKKNKQYTQIKSKEEV